MYVPLVDHPSVQLGPIHKDHTDKDIAAKRKFELRQGSDFERVGLTSSWLD
jgi:hypothetical protein